MAELPYYTSQKQAASALGLDVATVKQACTEEPSINRAGGRIDKAGLAAWAEKWATDLSNRSDASGAVNIDNATTAEIKRLRELVTLKLALLKLDKERDAMLPVADFEAALSQTLSHFRATINALPGRAAGKIVLRARANLLLMLKASLTPTQFGKVEQVIQTAPVDYADIEEILQAETGHLLTALETCDYLPEE